MKRLFPLLLFCCLLYSQTPDIQQSLTFTGTGPGAPIFLGAPGASNGVVALRLTYYVDGTSFTAAIMSIEGADAANSAGCAGASYSTITTAGSSVVEIVNPSASGSRGTIAVKAYFPCIRMNLTGTTGAGGTVTALLYGYKNLFLFPVTATVTPSGTQNVAIVSPIGANPISASISVAPATDSAEIGCQSPQQALFNLASSGNTRVVTGTAAKSVRICHISFATTPGEDVKLTQGTGATCGTSTADLTGLYKSVAAIALDTVGTLIVTSGLDLCINQTGTQALGGVVTYTVF